MDELMELIKQGFVNLVVIAFVAFALVLLVLLLGLLLKTPEQYFADRDAFIQACLATERYTRLECFLMLLGR